MKATLLLFRWELRRVVTNWRQAMSVFLVPSLVLLIAVYAFPFILNYLSSGTVGRGSIYLVDPDETFVEHVRSRAVMSGVRYESIDGAEFLEMVRVGTAAQETSSGSVFAVFSAFPFEGDNGQPSFSEAVRKYYFRLSEGDRPPGSTAFIFVYYDEGNTLSQTNSMIIEEEVTGRFAGLLLSEFGRGYSSLGGGSAFDRNRLNPYKTLMDHRSNANPAAGRVLPGVLILLTYYCVYSLSADTLAADRQRGFLAKLALTPVGSHSLVLGKAGAVIVVASVSSIITLIVFILSSWVNFSDAPNSLLPFGLMIFPGELLVMLTAIVTAAMMMTAFCFSVSMTLSENQDVMLNLQLPLVLFLGEFFAHLFRGTDALWGEYLIPAHGSLVLIRDVLYGTLDYTKFLVVILINLSLAIAMFSYSVMRFSPTEAAISEIRRTQ